MWSIWMVMGWPCHVFMPHREQQAESIPSRTSFRFLTRREDLDASTELKLRSRGLGAMSPRFIAFTQD